MGPPANLQETNQMSQRADMTLFIGVNGADVHPIQFQIVLNTAYNHFYLKFKPAFMTGLFHQQAHQWAADQAVTGLIVGDGLSGCPRKERRSERVAQSAHGRHLPEIAPADNQICTCELPALKESRYFSRVVLSVGIQRDDRLHPLFQRSRKAAQQSSALALIGLLYQYLCAGSACLSGSIIRRTIVYHQYGQVLAGCPDHPADVRCFVVRRYQRQYCGGGRGLRG